VSALSGVCRQRTWHFQVNAFSRQRFQPWYFPTGCAPGSGRRFAAAFENLPAAEQNFRAVIPWAPGLSDAANGLQTIAAVHESASLSPDCLDIRKNIPCKNSLPAGKRTCWPKAKASASHALRCFFLIDRGPITIYH
jgi:hypothetical protein